MLSNLPPNPFQSFIESRKAKGISLSSLNYYRIVLSRAFWGLGNPYTAQPEDITAYLNTIPPNKNARAPIPASGTMGVCAAPSPLRVNFAKIIVKVERRFSLIAPWMIPAPGANGHSMVSAGK